MSLRDLTSFQAPAWQDLPDLGLYMDQVIGVLEKHLAVFFGEEKVLTSTMINNYVKNRLLPPPVNKKYERAHLARLYQLCVCKSFMQLSDAARLLAATEEGRTPEEAHAFFCLALDGAVGAVFKNKKASVDEADPVARALYAACVAAACILRAGICFEEARLGEAPPQKESKPRKAPKKKNTKKSS